MIWLLACSSRPVDRVMSVEVRPEGVFFEGEATDSLRESALLWHEEHADGDNEVHLRLHGDARVRQLMEAARELDSSGEPHTHLGLLEGLLLPMAFDAGCHHPMPPERFEPLERSLIVTLQAESFEAIVWSAPLDERGCPVQGTHTLLEVATITQATELAQHQQLVLSAKGELPFSRLFQAAQDHGPASLGASWPAGSFADLPSARTRAELEAIEARWVSEYQESM